ncbi:unnamed protein product [Cercopithifilaria johnstoni]|uniref:Uncharacterized protein n=1 Tax=Cercopithifilaria johnstoni TaxID=2874296 RepID=A0A8J2Q330_9BILA|nr:unnamed protein product [Cercopithifilaria johnstoni]
MKRSFTLVISLVLIIGVKANIESNVWRLVDAVYPKDLAVNICHRLNIQNGIVEHFGTNYSKVYCIWPKIFSDINYCAAGFRLNSSSEAVESLYNCSEAEILAELRQESPKRSLEIIFTTIGKKDREMLDAKHAVNESIEQLDSNNSPDGGMNVKIVNDREAMILQLDHYKQNKGNDCHGD